MGTSKGFPKSLPSVSATSAGHTPMSSGGTVTGSTRTNLGEARRANVKRMADAGLAQAGGNEGGNVGIGKGGIGGTILGDGDSGVSLAN